ncbi:hypothetical protein JCM10207_007991 [Rhodosporidiobolus poonsookiae]
MEPPSSDGLEILSAGDFASFRSNRPPTTGGSSSFSAQPGAGGSRAPMARPAGLGHVIELSDDDGEEDGRGGGDENQAPGRQGGASRAVQRAKAAAFDPSSAASDELPAASAFWNAVAARTNAPQMGRSASMTVGTSRSAGLTSAPLARSNTLPTTHAFEKHPSSSFSLPSGFSSSPAPRAAPPLVDKGKTRPPARRPFNPSSSDTEMEETQLADDPWADILGGSPKKAGAKGKGQKKAEVGTREGAGKKKKRLFNDESSSEEEVGMKGKKVSKAKAPRLSPPAKSAKASASASAASAAPTLSKAALKKQETAERMRLREANTLRTGDKKASTAELTVHISGTAFAALDDEDGGGESDDSNEEMYAPRTSKNTGKGKNKGKDKPSPWLEICASLRERLKLYDCDVECPEVPRRDLGCEGTVRWTRVCDRKWSEERKMYLPLPDGERIVVEEDSRLVFLTALDLSHHVASRTLSTHIRTLQSRLPPHVNLFLLLYGMADLARDLERARQEAYRASIRAAEGEAMGGKGRKKAAGIGENQPSKDELEMELMRVQMQSRCMIVSVNGPAEAVDWLEQLTFDVGQKPYQRLKHSHIALLGTSEDTVKSGADLQDTYLRMLASLPSVTDAVARGIAADYPTMRELYEAWDKCGGEREREKMLVGIGKGRNINGTSTHRLIGSTLSANVYKIMNSRDPGMFL